MFGIPLPYLLLGLSLALFGTYRGGYHFGWSDRDKEMQIAIAKKNEEAREIERNMTTKLNATATQLMETTNVVNQKQSALDNAIRSGRMRISSPSCVQAPTSPSVATTDTKAGSQPSGQTNETSDSERETLLAIAEIVAAGDRNTAALNACITAYEDVRSLVNGK
jgi:hypothetical protein